MQSVAEHRQRHPSCVHERAWSRRFSAGIALASLSNYALVTSFEPLSPSFNTGADSSGVFSAAGLVT